MAADDDYRALSLRTWDSVAEGWERHRAHIDEQNRPVAEALVAALAPRPGETLLELACGVGDVGYAALERAGGEAHLISTDFAPEMLQAARRRAAELGLADVEHRVIDAEAMDLEDGSVDGVICRFGYMLMADPARALRETRRVLRPGGRVAFATWAAPDRNPAMAMMGAALVAHGLVPPPEPGPGIFAIPTAERATELAQEAGFEAVDVSEVAITVRHSGAEEWFTFSRDIAGPFAALLAGLSEEEAAAVRGSIEEWSGAWRTDGGYELPGVALVALAR